MTTKDAKAPDNFDRLRNHLKADSLAAKLTEAHHAAQPAGRMRSMIVVLQARLTEVRSNLDIAKT